MRPSGSTLVADGLQIRHHMATEKFEIDIAHSSVGFAVGHASAQQVWRGLRSRPTWRVLCYSSENPPRRRGLVLVDAVHGEVLQHLVQDNPETDWVEPS